jgi:hypothetical protein
MSNDPGIDYDCMRDEISDLWDFVKNTKHILDNAYGGVLYWSEADAFVPIYEQIAKLENEYNKGR